MNFPWNRQVWMYSKSSNFNPSHWPLIINRHGGRIVPFLIPTGQRNTSESNNPLLITQIAGAPGWEAER